MTVNSIRNLLSILLVIEFLVTSLGCTPTGTMPTTPEQALRVPPSVMPPPSDYPADIIGHVIIAKKVLYVGLDGIKREALPMGPDRAFWIIEVSINNKQYQLPIAVTNDSTMPKPKGVYDNRDIWQLIYNGQTWSRRQEWVSPQTPIGNGQVGKLLLAFEGKYDFNSTSPQLSYQGQEPFSYGNFILDKTVAVYDWELKKVTQATETPSKTANKVTTVATVKDIFVSVIGPALTVEMTPNNNAIANTVYTVDLYEKNTLRASSKVSFNQPEINVSSSKLVFFPLKPGELDAYMGRDISGIFSAKVHN